MSTLYNALKKAESERQKTTGPSIKTGPTVQGMMENVKVVVLLIAVIVVFAIAFYRFKGLWQAPKAGGTVVQTATTANQPGATVSPSNVPAAPYVLDGIINSGKDSLAIINGKLLKPEGTIDNLVLKSISSKEVELLDTKNNSTVVLKIQ